MNTLGNCLVVDTPTESCLIAPNGGYGGVGGGFTKHVALANVAQATPSDRAPYRALRSMPLTRACTAQLRTRLDPTVDIVGVGGVASGDDAFQLILADATAVQVALLHGFGKSE